MSGRYHMVLSLLSLLGSIHHFHTECFHSRGQHICKFIGTKESVCIRKEFNSQRTGLGHQHGRRFIVSGHQSGLRLCLNHTVQKDSRGVLGTSFRFRPTSEILENIQYGGSSVVENWQPREPFYRQRSVILRYCWRSLRLLWLLKSSWSCIVSNPFINVLSICRVPLAGITEENSTVQGDILNYGNKFVGMYITSSFLC